jgi:hypothetical protein
MSGLLNRGEGEFALLLILKKEAAPFRGRGLPALVRGHLERMVDETLPAGVRVETDAAPHQVEADTDAACDAADFMAFTGAEHEAFPFSGSLEKKSPAHAGDDY